MIYTQDFLSSCFTVRIGLVNGEMRKMSGEVSPACSPNALLPGSTFLRFCLFLISHSPPVAAHSSDRPGIGKTVRMKDCESQPAPFMI